MKKILKWIGIIIVSLIVLAVIAGIVMNKKKPVGQTGPEAEALAQKMMTAINQPAWDSTKVCTWTFRGANHYLWDKERNYAEIKWKNNRVLMRLDDVDGIAYVDDKKVDGDQKKKLIDKAWSNWCNDSFWFNAPSKVFDKGTERSIVDLEDGSKGLMITYKTGGVTPGDSYLWKLDKNGLPKSWQMWVKIIPVGGIGNSWEGWVTTETGAKISSLHKDGIPLEVTNIKGVMSFDRIGIDGDPFGVLVP